MTFEVRRLRDLTLSPEGELTQSGQVERKGLSVVSAWHVQGRFGLWRGGIRLNLKSANVGFPLLSIGDLGTEDIGMADL
jgi:hypothetical protein